MTPNDKMALMRQIQAYSFAVLEVGLYLNTHPNDAEAMAYYEKYNTLLRESTEAYECKFGPLTMRGVKGDTWSWINDPWPWEFDNMSCSVRG